MTEGRKFSDEQLGNIQAVFTQIAIQQPEYRESAARIIAEASMQRENKDFGFTPEEVALADSFLYTQQEIQDDKAQAELRALRETLHKQQRVVPSPINSSVSQIQALQQQLKAQEQARTISARNDADKQRAREQEERYRILGIEQQMIVQGTEALLPVIEDVHLNHPTIQKAQEKEPPKVETWKYWDDPFIAFTVIQLRWGSKLQPTEEEQEFIRTYKKRRWKFGSKKEEQDIVTEDYQFVRFGVTPDVMLNHVGLTTTIPTAAALNQSDLMLQLVANALNNSYSWRRTLEPKYEYKDNPLPLENTIVSSLHYGNKKYKRICKMD